MTHTKKPAGVRAKGAALLAAAALLSGFGLAGCGGDDEPEGGPGGFNVTGMSLADALALITNDTKNPGSYTITLSGNETSGPVPLAYSGRTVAITLTGGTVTLKDKGSLFTVGKNVTLTLDGVTLAGTAGNNAYLVYVDGGTVIMKDGHIKGNAGGGVGVYVGGTFALNGGKISDNTAQSGGGVSIGSDGIFMMSGGTIYSNTATSGGGGVHFAGSVFTMSGGAITSNKAEKTATGTAGVNGGGVYVSHGVFTMSEGTISSNTADNNGGGVFVLSSTFTMSGGEIISNNAVSATNGYGGGVFVSGTFTKEGTGGVIYGYTAGDSKFNKCLDDNKAIVSNKGHAVYYEESGSSTKKYRDTTVSAADTLSTTGSRWNE